MSAVLIFLGMVFVAIGLYIDATSLLWQRILLACGAVFMIALYLATAITIANHGR
jgi:1,4-dihydroxy-2-naphthoate octaprenyltransferase